MKRRRIRALLGGTSTIAFGVGGIPLPGCESLVFDPQAFLAENTCNIFNCDTLFFLGDDHADNEHDEMDETMDEHDEMDTAATEDHAHG